MRPLRVVLLTLEPPLPFGNAVGRWYYVLLKGLAERGHQVAAFAACKAQADADEAMRLFPEPVFSLRCYPPEHRRALQSKVNTLLRPQSNLFSPSLRRDLDRELAAGFDILHMEAHWSGWLGLAHRDRAVMNVHYLFQIDLAGQQAASAIEKVQQVRDRKSVV